MPENPSLIIIEKSVDQHGDPQYGYQFALNGQFHHGCWNYADKEDAIAEGIEQMNEEAKLAAIAKIFDQLQLADIAPETIALALSAHVFNTCGDIDAVIQLERASEAIAEISAAQVD